ncbi:MAG: hypothetical protein AB7O97_02640 [Planctomycetota bacterium]
MKRPLLLAALTAVTAAALPAQNCFDTVLGTDLNFFDDDAATLPLGFTFTFAGVAYTDVTVCSNGFLWLGTGAGSANLFDFSPSEAELLAEPPRICPLWTDLEPDAPGSGHVYYKSTPGVSATVTWAGVYEYFTTNPIEMQIVLDASNGIKITYGANAAQGALTSPTVIIGVSAGGGAAANPISLATRPVVVTQDTFYELITPPVPYAGFQMQWISTAPGYLVSDNTCTLNGLPGPASFDVVGAGCPTRQGPAMYETFDGFATIPDLSGLDLSFLPTGASDYLVLPGLSPTFFTGVTNNLAMSDDQSISVPLPFSFPYAGGTVTSIYVSSNGFLTLGTTDPGSGCCFGDVTTMLSGPPIIAAWWADLYPPGGGGVYADLDTATGEFVVTWDQVPEYFTNPPQTAQIALSPTGQFTIRWGTVSTTSHNFLTGYSGGGGSPDPGPTDLSGVSSATVSSLIIQPLELDAAPGAVPQVGGSMSLDVTNIPAAPNGNIVILLISTEIPATGLDFLGMTGCTAFLSLPEIAAFTNLTFGAPTTSFVVPIPPDPAFYGFSVMSQAISDDAVSNPFGFIASNGGRWNLGL